MSEGLRFALLGAGEIARVYVQVFGGSDAARVVVVADEDAERAASLGARLGCPGTASSEAVLDSIDAGRLEVDAALICTPPVTHGPLTLALLTRGVHVLCEKPFTIRSDEALEAVAAARRARVTLAMAAKFRYADDLIRAREIVESGAIGDVVRFENCFASSVDMRRRWNSDPAVSGGGVLIDNGTHSVDIARLLLGPVTDVLAIDGGSIQGLAVEDTVELVLRTGAGVTGRADLSWSFAWDRATYVDLYGTHGAVHVGWAGSWCTTCATAVPAPFGTGYDKLACLRGELDNFCAAVRGEEELRISTDDVVASVAVIEAAYASLLAGGWACVADHTGSADESGRA